MCSHTDCGGGESDIDMYMESGEVVCCLLLVLFLLLLFVGACDLSEIWWNLKVGEMG